MQIEGATVLITGGQRGLGAAFADELLAQGVAKVYVTARNPRPSEDARVVSVALDITSQEDVDRVAALAKDVTILINNAGMDSVHAVLGVPLENMRDVFDSNVFGTLRMSQAFAPILAANAPSSLVNVHSVLSWLAGAGAYGASKAALWSFTNSLRLELADQGVRVVGVHLGLADTEMAAEYTGPKVAPDFVARELVAGIASDDAEILVDAASQHVKSKLAGPVEELHTSL